MAIGTIGGPWLGGFVTGHFDWRWAFYINLPLGLDALVWLALLLHLPAQPIKARIDWVGIALLTVSITAFVLAATWAGITYAWSFWQIIGLGFVAVRPWGRPALPNKLTLARVRRGFRNLRTTYPPLARAPKPAKPGPGRPLGSTNHRRADRYEVGQLLITGELY
ncbi:hypothetical protein ABZ726_00160 [Streptomyces hundungensis]